MDIDSFVESLWLRALDLTSKDFKSEKAYLTGKANYEKLARQALQSYIDTKVIEGRKKTASDIFNLAHQYASEDKTMKGAEELRSYHYYNAIAKIGEFDGR
jgi:hypothetical protein